MSKRNVIIPLCIVGAFLIALFALRGAHPIVLAIVVLLGVAAFVFRARLGIWLSAKAREWASDWKQLGLWLHLAFKRNRDAHSTAAMAHQQQFLSGRIMSPMNLFAFAALAVVGSMGAIGIEEWRIGRLKRERDAPCSQRELSLNDRGNYRTSRASCSALGATLGVAVQWRERANEIQALRETDIETVRVENENEIVAERARRARAAASASRQRRRQNEAIEAGLGGPAPDLERSVCELAGGVGCGPAGAGDVSEPAAAGNLSNRSGDTVIVADPVTP